MKIITTIMCLALLSFSCSDVKQNVQATLINDLGQVILTKQFTSTSSIHLNINAPTETYFLKL